MNQSHLLRQALQKLLPNVDPQAISIGQILGGRNNQAYRISVDAQNYFLKFYNKPLLPHHNRLKTEYDFLRYAQEIQCPYTAKPVGFDEEVRLGLYEFIEGNRFTTVSSLSRETLEYALDFMERINKQRDLPRAQSLPNAAEACFSLQDHLHCIEMRVQKLLDLKAQSDIDEEANHFIQNEMIPVWEQLKACFLSSLKGRETEINITLSDPYRIISPSDFGFHNALQINATQIKFVDFEYAGWDDPAKLIADFFCQIEVPVAMDYFADFAARIGCIVQNPDGVMRRAALLLPLYRLKWMAIVLNYFRTDINQVKQFVSMTTDDTKRIQLNKARKILNLLH